METGCGSTLYKPLGAFSGSQTAEETKANLTLNNSKIDEDFSSCRTPLEVLKDCLQEPGWLENISASQRKSLERKSEILKEISPPCDCLGPDAPENGPYYVHLGHAESQEKLRKNFEERLAVSGAALRVVCVRFTGKEGKTVEDCPIAKWIIRRTSPEEKFVVVMKERYKHFCQFAWVAISVLQWDGVSPDLADRAYTEIAFKTSQFGSETERQCAANKKKTCACQGLDMNYNGASYTFGCSWTMYHNICKFCRSSEVHKFKLSEEAAEGNLAAICEELTNEVSPAYQAMTPDSFNNMQLFEEVAGDCRVGAEGSKVFSGITCVCDFCAHAHKDSNNMVGGATAVVTLLRPEDREAEAQEDQQFHVLPLYVPDCTEEELDAEVASNGLVVLDKFTRTIAIRKTKKSNCKRGRLNAERKRMLDGLASKDKAGMPQVDGLDNSISSDSSFSLNSSNESFSSNSSFDRSSQELDGILEELKIVTHETDCLEAFDDPNIGGVAFALTHGSILVECAKQELHATTALRAPDRSHPHRIGLVFYQHKNLHHPSHGSDEFRRKKVIRDFRDYGQWLKGNFVPTESKLKTMLDSGFSFPENVKTLDKPMDIARPEDYFQSDSYAGYDKAKAELRDFLASIPREPDHNVDILYIDREEVGGLEPFI